MNAPMPTPEQLEPAERPATTARDVNAMSETEQPVRRANEGLADLAEMFAARAAEARAWTDTCPTCSAKVPTAGACFACVDRALQKSQRREFVTRQMLGVPESLRWSRFGAPELSARVKDRRALALAERVIELPPIVVLTGEAGLGKTSLAVALYRRELERTGKPGFYVDAFRLSVARSDAPLGRVPDDEAYALEAHVLVLDDLGSERQVPSSPLADIVFERHASNQRTIVTTWASQVQIVQRYGGGIGRRLFERSTVIALKGGGK